MMPTRLSHLAALALLLLAGCAVGVAAAERPPNIVLIVADDMGYGDSTAYWQTDLQTPVMDAVAQQGIRFTQFRVNPLCAPTRASIFTGLDSLACGMWRGPGAEEREPEPEGGWSDAVRRIKDDVVMLPQLLQRAGYATGIFGKWHLGYDPKNQPNARGFDQFVGFLGGSHTYWLRRNAQILHNTQPLDASGHTTDVFADAAIEFVKANRGRPFFCYVPFNAVHGPLRSADHDADSGKPEWLARYAEAGVDQPRRDYCAVMSHADARVGDILQTLSDLELENNTLVIYLSDNGGILEKYPSNNGPLRGGKGTTYEGGIRVPAVMQWPDAIPAGSVSDAAAVHFDLFSTILDAADVAVPQQNGDYAVHGVSLLPLLRSGGRSALPDRYLFWDLYGACGALHGRWKLVGEIPNHHGRFDQAARDAQSATFALYDLETDLGEQHDLRAERPEIYDDLKSRHLHWLRQFAR